MMQLNRDNVISSESFALASFDNIDKNQSYALVGSGKDKSGFMIAFSKHTQKPVTDLDQLILLPRAISDTSGQPLKAGGFDDASVDKALGSLGAGDGSIVESCHLDSNHEEGDTRWYTKGCSCKSGCTTLRCSCKKSANKYCSPGCKCVNCVNLPTNLNQAVDDPDSDLEDSEHEEDISYDSDSETDINEFEADTSANTSTSYINYWDTFLNYIFALPTY
ncbi:LIN54 [Mytilus coruscus]|uniref:LIN54 n=1 Tax=Mytilus coruscus TaxID=42192 RepID=A0A6J7ZV97_MYTCO|nr:LIN54 [Mytilus coruscus]